jgi:uncharacterized protein (TIGR03083 family)
MNEGPEHMTEDELRELLAAHALHASLPEEEVRIERLLATDPAAAAEFHRLSNAAAWIGATEALTPPPTLRRSVLAAARERRHAALGDALMRLYRTETDRFAALVTTLRPEELAARTANGLSVRDLLIHLAAMESMVSAGLGTPVTTIEAGTDVEARTARFVEELEVRPIDDVLAIWRDGIDGVMQWAATGAPQGLLPWLGVDVQRDTLLISRAFETWIHADDIRRATGRPLTAPDAGRLTLMTDLAVRILPMALQARGRSDVRGSAHIVLTGPGGGAWVQPLGREPEPGPPEVSIVADVVDFCRFAGRRLPRVDLDATIEGDRELAEAVLEAAASLAV